MNLNKELSLFAYYNTTNSCSLTIAIIVDVPWTEWPRTTRLASQLYRTNERQARTLGTLDKERQIADSVPRAHGPIASLLWNVPSLTRLSFDPYRIRCSKNVDGVGKLLSTILHRRMHWRNDLYKTIIIIWFVDHWQLIEGKSHNT